MVMEDKRCMVWREHQILTREAMKMLENEEEGDQAERIRKATVRLRKVADDLERRTAISAEVRRRREAQAKEEEEAKEEEKRRQRETLKKKIADKRNRR